MEKGQSFAEGMCTQLDYPHTKMNLVTDPTLFTKVTENKLQIQMCKQHNYKTPRRQQSKMPR